jgi:hypothetical protein
MIRLIDADALIKYANNSTVGIDANDIARFPRVDAVPVVRCGECKGWVATENSDLGICALTKRVVTRRDYCSWGRRKDGAE